MQQVIPFNAGQIHPSINYAQLQQALQELEKQRANTKPQYTTQPKQIATLTTISAQPNMAEQKKQAEAQRLAQLKEEAKNRSSFQRFLMGDEEYVAQKLGKGANWTIQNRPAVLATSYGGNVLKAAQLENGGAGLSGNAKVRLIGQHRQQLKDLNNNFRQGLLNADPLDPQWDYYFDEYNRLAQPLINEGEVVPNPLVQVADRKAFTVQTQKDEAAIANIDQLSRRLEDMDAMPTDLLRDRVQSLLKEYNKDPSAVADVERVRRAVATMPPEVKQDLFNTISRYHNDLKNIGTYALSSRGMSGSNQVVNEAIDDVNKAMELLASKDPKVQLSSVLKAIGQAGAKIQHISKDGSDEDKDVSAAVESAKSRYEDIIGNIMYFYPPSREKVAHLIDDLKEQKKSELDSKYKLFYTSFDNLHKNRPLHKSDYKKLKELDDIAASEYNQRLQYGTTGMDSIRHQAMDLEAYKKWKAEQEAKKSNSNGGLEEW